MNMSAMPTIMTILMLSTKMIRVTMMMKLIELNIRMILIVVLNMLLMTRMIMTMVMIMGVNRTKLNVTMMMMMIRNIRIPLIIFILLVIFFSLLLSVMIKDDYNNDFDFCSHSASNFTDNNFVHQDWQPDACYLTDGYLRSSNLLSTACPSNVE